MSIWKNTEKKLMRSVWFPEIGMAKLFCLCGPEMSGIARKLISSQDESVARQPDKSGVGPDCLILWDMKRKLTVIACILFVCSGFLRLTAAERCDEVNAVAHRSGDGRVVRLVTYNVGVFNKYIKDDFELVADLLKQTGAEAVCLNELDSCAIRTGGVFQLARIAGLMGDWNYYFGPAMLFQGGSYGVGVISRQKPLDVFRVVLPKADGSEPRALAVVELEDYVLATTHLDYKTATAQKAQIAVIDSVMNARYGRCGKPVFLGGDMNARPNSDAIALLCKGWKLLTATDGGTIPSDAPSACIDYIFMLDNGASCDVISSRIITESTVGDIVKASDHLPVYLEVMLSVAE